MQITLDFPDDMALPLDAALKLVNGRAFTNNKGELEVSKQWPNGLSDMIQAVCQQNFGMFCRDYGIKTPAIEALEAVQEQLQEAFDTATKPTLKISTAESK